MRNQVSLESIGRNNEVELANMSGQSLAPALMFFYAALSQKGLQPIFFDTGAAKISSNIQLSQRRSSVGNTRQECCYYT